MIYVSQHIINIPELELLISSAKLQFEFLMDELKKEKPSQHLIEFTSRMLKDCLEKASQFEFRIDARICEVKETDHKTKWKENREAGHSEE